MTSPVALIFQVLVPLTSTFTAVAVDVHAIGPIPRSWAVTSRFWVQVLSSQHDTSPCGFTATVAATRAESRPSSRGPNVVGASVSAAASSGLPFGAHAFSHAAANLAMTCAAAASLSSGSAGLFPPLDLLSVQPDRTPVSMAVADRHTIAVRFTEDTFARGRTRTSVPQEANSQHRWFYSALLPRRCPFLLTLRSGIIERAPRGRHWGADHGGR